MLKRKSDLKQSDKSNCASDCSDGQRLLTVATYGALFALMASRYRAKAAISPSPPEWEDQPVRDTATAQRSGFRPGSENPVTM
jgi:hypothetical protein